VIIKKRKKPLILQKYEALLPRLSRMKPEIQQEYIKYKKGYEGELKVDYYINQLDSSYTILQDVCLDVQGQVVQMDNLVLTENAIYIIEVKNYYGKIIFDTVLCQFTRDDGEKETGFKHPIMQVDLQKLKLQLWLRNQDIENIPIYYFIAISDPSTIIKVNGNEKKIAETVIHAEHLPGRMVEKELSIKEERQLQHRRIGYQILRECKDFDMDIMEKHGLNYAELTPGVACPACGLIGMKRIHSGWICKRCRKKYRHAHLQALEAHRLLIKSSIKNSECMHWLKLDSRYVATRILRSARFEYDRKRVCWERKG